MRLRLSDRDEREGEDRHIQEAVWSGPDGGQRGHCAKTDLIRAVTRSCEGEAARPPQRIGASPAPNAVKIRVVIDFMPAATSGKSPTGW